jgi:ParB family transcriptional regulator, chromosome partitioning protein
MPKTHPSQDNTGSFKLPLSQLKLISEAPQEIRERYQVRKSDDTSGIDELEASLRHNGLIYPLIIAENAYTIAGNRRLKCLRKLSNGDDPMIDVVDVRNFKGDEREIAMAVNIALPPHPVDRYEVLAAQHAAGLSVDDIADRNALTTAQVKRILALAALAPEIRDAWRAGKLERDVAQAFTLAPDQEEQIKFWNKIKSSGHISAWQVHEKFIGAKDRDVGKILEFVGVEEYELAGGTVRRDLFGVHHAVSDHSLLQQLFHAKMAVLCDDLIKDGWSFAIPVTELGQERYAYGVLEVAKVTSTKAEKQQLSDLQDRIDASDDDFEAANDFEDLEAKIRMRAFTPEHKARSGCFVEITADGTPKVEYGRTKPPEKSKAAKPAKPDKSKATKDGAKAAPAEASSVVKFRLEQQLLKATAAALTKAESKGLPGMLARVIAELINWQRPGMTPEAVSASLPMLRKAIPPKIMIAALVEAFDRKDYFNSIPKDLIAAAVSSSMGVSHATKVRTMSKEGAAKFAIGNIPKGWLPQELRTDAKVKRK